MMLLYSCLFLFRASFHSIFLIIFWDCCFCFWLLPQRTFLFCSVRFSCSQLFHSAFSQPINQDSGSFLALFFAHLWNRRPLLFGGGTLFLLAWSFFFLFAAVPFTFILILVLFYKYVLIHVLNKNQKNSAEKGSVWEGGREGEGRVHLEFWNQNNNKTNLLEGIALGKVWVLVFSSFLSLSLSLSLFLLFHIGLQGVIWLEVQPLVFVPSLSLTVVRTCLLKVFETFFSARERKWEKRGWMNQNIRVSELWKSKRFIQASNEKRWEREEISRFYFSTIFFT